MRQKHTKSRLAWLLRALAVIGTTIVCVMIALAAGRPCDSYIPKCAAGGCTIGAGCGAGGEIVACTPHSGFWYHCNGKATDCPVDPGLCNIYVKTEVSGYLVSCEDVSITVGFCASSAPGVSTPMNLKCEGGPCIEGTTADELPTLIGPMADENWPFPAPSWEGPLDPM